MATPDSTHHFHAVMFPWFAFGHIAPFVQLSNKLSANGVRISFLSAPGNIPRINTTLHLSSTTQVIPIPIPLFPGIPPGVDSTSHGNPAIAELLKLALDQMKPQIHTLLSQLKPHFIFFDFAHYWIPTIASQLNIKSVFFSVYSAISSAYIMHPDRVATIENLLKPPPDFPLTTLTSIKKYEARDFLYLFTRFNDGPPAIQRSMAGANTCDVILKKTCHEMEGPYIDYIRTQFKKPVLVSGPLVPAIAINNKLENAHANWLEQFGPKSVIFCNFGSETFLTREQIQEVALGLELTGMPFFLVLNFPVDINVELELEAALPKGFIERVKGRGVVHTGWVQQQMILGHENVGCYLNHSGFSSIIEGILTDCQLVLLPLKGDQFLNCRLIVGDMKVGVEVKRRDEDGWFGRDDVNEAVKSIMMEVEKKLGKSVRVNFGKWREFLLNCEIQDKFVSDLVMELKSML